MFLVKVHFVFLLEEKNYATSRIEIPRDYLLLKALVSYHFISIDIQVMSSECNLELLQSLVQIRFRILFD